MADRNGGLRNRHPRDAVSLILGLLLMAIAGVFLLTDATDVNLDARWVWPAVFIGIGMIGLAASVRRRQPR
jgi:hypothetical protein